MMRPPNWSLLSEAPKTATERGCRMRSTSTRGIARAPLSAEVCSAGAVLTRRLAGRRSCRRTLAAVGHAWADLAVLEDEPGALVHDAGPVRDGLLGPLAVRARLVVEVAESVGAAYQERRLADARWLGPSRQHLDQQEEAAVGAEIGAGAVHERVVEHCHLAGFQREVHRLGLVERLADVLPPGQDAPRIVALLVLEDAPLVRAGNAAQAAVIRSAVREREGAQDYGERRAVGRVLVPAGERLAVGLLHAPSHAPAAKIGADQVFEDVEDVRILGDVEHPRAEEMRLGLHLLDVVGEARLQRLEARAIRGRALRAHRAYGRQEPLLLELVDLGFGEDLGHGDQASASMRTGVSCAGL